MTDEEIDPWLPVALCAILLLTALTSIVALATLALR